MYVTRRLLRSTMPPEADAVRHAPSEKEEKPEIPFLPPPTPKRRAAVRASAKICAVVADGSGPSIGRKAAKQSPKHRENGGDEKNKRRSHKKKAKTEQQQPKSEEKEAPVVAKLHGHELMVDVRYRNEYIEARIQALDPENERIFVHYMGWNARYDAWVTLDDVAAHGSHSGAAKKKDVSWDGTTSLFATPEEVAAGCKQGASKSKAKKRVMLSPKARKPARRAASKSPGRSDRKRRKEAVEENDEEQPPAKKIARKSSKSGKSPKGMKSPRNAKSPRYAKSPRNAKSSRRGKSPRSAKSPRNSTASAAVENDEIDAQSARIRRSSRRVQVAVGTTDEASERKRNTETADLVLDVEIEGREPSNDEADGEAEHEENVPSSRAKKHTKSKRSSKKRSKRTDEARDQSKRKRKMNKEHDDPEFTPEKKNMAKKTNRGELAHNPAPELSPTSGHGGLSSPMRKKLGAIFRQRVEQRVQLEQLTADEAGFQQSLQAETMDAGSLNGNDNETSSAEADASAVPIVSSTAAADEYQRQLQQYYYHQQVMLASSLSMSVPCSDDPSAMALQGGIIDPRVIQDRLTALEERRRQQAQIQAYYRQLMLTRERNVRALAANQAFMTSSAAVWEQQLKETQSEEDAASVRSWKDVPDTPSSIDRETEEAAQDPTFGEDADDSAQSLRSISSVEGDASDANEDSKDSETSASSKVASPDTVEKTERSPSPKSTPAKHVMSSSSGKCNPTDTPAQVLYEFVL
ncbi:hypothetical protein PHYBOEH_001285 [Phytophthora boehmeriae]|uniref:Tudor-knot domain-containing protein n=1 Tax=Phytophthora boehmeriae TaxID=109152 RepID=A0A8T1WVC0_9STRA|nr:hypothetical protein PHYBOEH_001285 [Phytophthora boehmeriae]